jgi:hypothetical protein
MRGSESGVKPGAWNHPALISAGRLDVVYGILGRVHQKR